MPVWALARIFRNIARLVRASSFGAAMKAATIKRGTTFKATIAFDADEWAAIHPWTSVSAQVAQGSRVYPLAVAVDEVARMLTLTAPAESTRTWLTQETGRTSAAAFDVWVTRAGETIAIPGSHNIQLKIIEGPGR